MKTAFNETTAYANKLSSEISDNDTKLDGLKTSADGAASSVKDYSKATKEAGDVSNDTKTDVNNYKQVLKN